MKKEEFVQKFKDVFCKEYHKKMVYLWEPFARNDIVCLKGNLARNAYDEVDKINAFEIQYDNGFIGDNSAIPLQNEHMTSSGVDESKLFEFYIFDKDFSWCYIVTHEYDICGPFFIKSK